MYAVSPSLTCVTRPEVADAGPAAEVTGNRQARTMHAIASPAPLMLLSLGAAPSGVNSPKEPFCYGASAIRGSIGMFLSTPNATATKPNAQIHTAEIRGRGRAGRPAATSRLEVNA